MIKSEPIRYEESTVEKEFDRLAGELPEGYEVQLCVENGAGWVQVITPKGDTIEIAGDCETRWVTLMDDALIFCLDYSKGAKEPIRYEEPTPFTLWVEWWPWWPGGGGDSLGGRELGWAARWSHLGGSVPMIVIKLLPTKPRPVRYDKPTPFTLWVGENIYMGRYSDTGGEIGVVARWAWAHRRTGRYSLNHRLPKIAIKPFYPLYPKPNDTGNMKRGKTERETLELNGWGVGDILEGECSSQKLMITAIGEERFFCRWETWRLNESDPRWGSETGTTTLNAREWRKVGER